MNKKIFSTILPFLFFLALVIAGAKFLNNPDLPARVATWGIWAPFALIVLKASTIIIAPLGGNPIYLAAPKFFGLTKAIIYLVIGDTIGYLGAFGLARKFGNRILKKLLSGEQYEKSHGLLVKIATWKKFFVIRLILSPLSDILSYAAGLTKLPFWQFVLITILDVIIYVVLVTTLGHIFVRSAATFVMVTVLVGAVPAIFMAFRHAKKNISDPSI